MEQTLEKLFESTSKIKLLKLFLMNPEQEFTLAEIAKHTQLKPFAAKKELAKLLKISLVKSKILNIPDIKKVAAKRPKRKVAPKKLHAKQEMAKNKHTATMLTRKQKAKKRK
ncbi:hypothetical protein KGQ34_00080 [Patescibacteria group bacterium]|nr:hypothetical protein [Patescibacteria group bacterium]